MALLSHGMCGLAGNGSVIFRIHCIHCSEIYTRCSADTKLVLPNRLNCWQIIENAAAASSATADDSMFYGYLVANPLGMRFIVFGRCNFITISLKYGYAMEHGIFRSCCGHKVAGRDRNTSTNRQKHSNNISCIVLKRWKAIGKEETKTTDGVANFLTIA